MSVHPPPFAIPGLVMLPKNGSSLPPAQAQSQIIEWFGLEGTLKIISFHPPCHGQGHLPPDQVAQSPIRPGLEHCQGGGSHSFSGQPIPVPHLPHSEDLQIFFDAAAGSAPSSRQASSSAEHTPFWCRQGPCSCLWARCASSCLEMPAELCIQLPTQVPPGQILKLPDLHHPSLSSFCRGKSESPLPRLEPKLF